MATVTRTYMIDDLDGSEEGVTTVLLSLDKKDYEIDLSAANTDSLREKLAKFLDVATPVRSAKTAPTKRGAKTAAVASNKERVAEIRLWAEQAGLKVSSRGRLSAEVVEKYKAEH